jgi:hypothetical protein
LAQPGPPALYLDDAKTSAAGLAMRHARALRGALRGPGAELLARLSDVCRLAATAAECVMCLPLAAAPGGLRGAVLLGFASRLALEPEHLASLVALCSALGGALGSGAVDDVLCVVPHVLGPSRACACGETTGEGAGRKPPSQEPGQMPARPRRSRGRGRPAPPCHPLLASVPEGSEDEMEEEEGDNDAAPAADMCKAPAPPPPAPARFSKILLLEVDLGKPPARHRVWLTYDSPAVEAEFAR